MTTVSIDPHANTSGVPWDNLTDLPLEAQRAQAQEMARVEPDLSAAELAARFGRKPPWGRQQIAAARRARKERRMLTLTETAEELGATHRFVRRLVAEQRIEFVRDGRYVRITKEAIAAYRERHTVKAVAE